MKSECKLCHGEAETDPAFGGLCVYCWKMCKHAQNYGGKAIEQPIGPELVTKTINEIFALVSKAQNMQINMLALGLPSINHKRCPICDVIGCGAIHIALDKQTGHSIAIKAANEHHNPNYFRTSVFKPEGWQCDFDLSDVTPIDAKISENGRVIRFAI